jgi:hypothetical protein
MLCSCARTGTQPFSRIRFKKYAQHTFSTETERWILEGEKRQFTGTIAMG